MNKWTVIAEEDEFGEIMIPLSGEFLSKYGWKEGDKLDWTIIEGAAIITNLSAKKREEDKTPVDKS